MLRSLEIECQYDVIAWNSLVTSYPPRKLKVHEREEDLDAIPCYWQHAQQLRFPVIQYTAREIPNGLLFWAFAQQRSASASAVFASRIKQHLA